MIDIGIADIVALVIESTTDYLVVFMPLFVLMIGIVLAYVVIMLILRAIYGGGEEENDKE